MKMRKLSVGPAYTLSDALSKSIRRFKITTTTKKKCKTEIFEETTEFKDNNVRRKKKNKICFVVWEKNKYKNNGKQQNKKTSAQCACPYKGYLCFMNEGFRFDIFLCHSHSAIITFTVLSISFGKVKKWKRRRRKVKVTGKGINCFSFPFWT